MVEVLPAPQPSQKKLVSPTKSEKTDVASYMGSSKSDLDEIKVKKGYHPSTQAALENHQQQKLEAGLPKYAISLEVVNQNYDGAKAGTLISDVVKKEVNSRTGKSFFPIRENITVEQATKKLKDEINRRTFPKGATLTADALSQHNKGVGSPLLNKTSRGASKELSFT